MFLCGDVLSDGSEDVDFMLTQAYNPECLDREAGLLLFLRRNPSLVESKLRHDLDNCAGTIQATEDLCFMKEIPLRGKHGKGKVALVDDEDYERVSVLKWRASAPKQNRGTSYARSGRCSLMHRLVLGLSEDDPHVDHKNGDGLDNRRMNLRVATVSQNAGNRPPGSNNSTGYRGVCFRRKEGTFQAQLAKQALGQYDTAEDAARAYDIAAREHFGEFAYINLPDATFTPTRRKHQRLKGKIVRSLPGKRIGRTNAETKR